MYIMLVFQLILSHHFNVYGEVATSSSITFYKCFILWALAIGASSILLLVHLLFKDKKSVAGE